MSYIIIIISTIHQAHFPRFELARHQYDVQYWIAGTGDSLYILKKMWYGLDVVIM